MSGDAPVYQWYEIENGGEPVALKTGKAKTLKIGMKAADWAGVVSKTYYCEAYNKSGKVVSKTVRTPSVTLWLDEAPMPASLAGTLRPPMFRMHVPPARNVAVVEAS